LDLLHLGIVVIGRNEGARLERSLTSALASKSALVYVDSGSIDDSVAVATRLGVPVWPLDPAQPFSAARARNEGFRQLLAAHPDLQVVQFLDGDCELDPDWLAAGLVELGRAPDVAVVCGHIHERDPNASPYNRMCALEWRQVPGDVEACGGNFMVRAALFDRLGGFRCEMTAGEEGDLCERVRELGHRIRMVDRPMVVHDAALLRFSQWWRRARRCGHAYAQGRSLHRQRPGNRFRREVRGLVVWGAALPALAALPAAATGGASLLLLGGYALLALRIHRHCRRRGWSRGEAILYAAFTVLSKFPGVIGLLQFTLNRWRGRPALLIEHKETRASDRSASTS
jgi:glycosyltransferase involved in cell wall biosynthesis